jgi:hypothetical protein
MVANGDAHPYVWLGMEDTTVTTMVGHVCCQHSCVDTGSPTRGCQGVSSKQWEQDSLGIASGMCMIQSFDKLFLGYLMCLDTGSTSRCVDKG